MRVEMKAEQTVEDAVGLRPGELLERLSNRTTGFMGCDDITEYAILDGKGNQNGTAVLTEHTDVKAPHHSTTAALGPCGSTRRSSQE
ncbi:hypothetical protein [Massilia soli]|uniref:Uncharacterized protein n=1 Tax=Massilia soli TaxID=2792854 RepID=A0ABS7SLT5_9BURK|nr:hypothetical protein [Massilia soli]MBZ2207126.1 hypothetical protein [Massilia soli]